jgi:tetratricopeptide (TPR) repeat protein
MPVQDHFGSDSHAAAFAKLDPLLDTAPTVTYRKLRDMMLKAEFNRAESEALPAPWREFCLASLEWAAGRDLEALRLLDAGSKASPRYYWFRYYIAEILLRRLDLYDMAREEIQGVIAKCPWLWEARNLWTESLIAVGHPEPLKAVKSVTVPEQSRAAFLAWRGALELWTGEYELAVKDLDVAAAMDNPDALCWRGGALCKLGRLQESKRDLDRLLEIDPHDPEGLVWRGELNRLLGRLPESLKDLADVIAISGDKPWAHVNRALVRLEQKDLLGAYKDFALMYLERRDVERVEKSPLSAAKLKDLLEDALAAARGCRRSDPHLNIGWMRAAGIKMPRIPESGSRLMYWARSMNLPVPPDSLDPRPIGEEQARAAMSPPPVPRRKPR